MLQLPPDNVNINDLIERFCINHSNCKIQMNAYFLQIGNKLIRSC